MSIPTPKLVAALNALQEVYASNSLGELRTTIPQCLRNVIDSDRASLNELRLDGDKRPVAPLPEPAYWLRFGEVCQRHVFEHPLWRSPASLDQPASVAFSHYKDDRDWNQSILYNEYYVPVGAREQMAAFICAGDGFRVSVGFNRCSGTFSPQERELFELIVPHLRLAWFNGLKASQERTRDYPRSLRALYPRSASTALCAGGRFSDLPSLAARLLSRGFPGARLAIGERLPESLGRWLNAQRKRLGGITRVPRPPAPLRLPLRDSHLVIRLATFSEDKMLLIIEERSRTNRATSSLLTTLTSREVEILDWIAEGKRNSEIAAILGISSRTVGKHVENLQSKLDVETRTAAARCYLSLQDT